jgi:hypothetical protein
MISTRLARTRLELERVRTPAQREVWQVCLVLSDHATTIARAYGLGTPVREMIMVARAEQGRVWRLDTDTGAFAIKELILRQTPADAVADVAYQEAMLATGVVPMPRPIRTGLDPAVIGATFAAIHQVHYAPGRPLIGWYTEPVGAPRWTRLLDEAKAADAPFAEALDAEITELLRLEALIAQPTSLQSCHRDLWATTFCRRSTLPPARQRDSRLWGLDRKRPSRRLRQPIGTEIPIPPGVSAP